MIIKCPAVANNFCSCCGKGKSQSVRATINVYIGDVEYKSEL